MINNLFPSKISKVKNTNNATPKALNQENPLYLILIYSDKVILYPFFKKFSIVLNVLIFSIDN